jgi:hypothetical protein
MDNNYYYLDLADEEYWLIRGRNGERFSVGYDKETVANFIKLLNNTHRPNVDQIELHKLNVCWNNHDKGDKCDYEIYEF